MQLFGINIDPANLTGSIDAAIEAKLPRGMAELDKLQPELNAAIEADIAIAKKLLAVYAVPAKAVPFIAKELDALAARVPAIAPEMDALKARLTAMAA